jgi:hypothetical protein
VVRGFAAGSGAADPGVPAGFSATEAGVRSPGEVTG